MVITGALLGFENQEGCKRIKHIPISINGRRDAILGTNGGEQDQSFTLPGRHVDCATVRVTGMPPSEAEGMIPEIEI